MNNKFVIRLSLLLQLPVFLTISLADAHAEVQTPDSIESTTLLDDLTVQASRRVMRGDTLRVIPTEAQRKMSQTGYELIRSALLPGLRVDAIQGTIATSDRQSVVLLLNGRPADKSDILALRPKSVAYIDYLQNGGAEYSYDGSIGAVINFVTKERTDGYAVGAITNNAVTTLYGLDFIYAKYDKGYSDFAVTLNSEYTSVRRRRIDDLDRYQIDDEWKEINRKGINTPLRYSENTLQMGYNYYVPDKTIFDATFKGVFYYSPHRSHRQLISETGAGDYYQTTNPYEKYLSPGLNLYFKHNLNKSSAITANLVGVYRNTDYRYNLSESRNEDFSDSHTTYGYDTRGNRQAYIGEVKYYNVFMRKIALHAGVRTSYTHTRNRYTGDTQTVDLQDEANCNAFVAAYGHVLNDRLYYYLGYGLNMRHLDYNGRRDIRYTSCPRIQFIYSLNDWTLSLLCNITQQAPSLSDMADTEYKKNSMEIVRGNPDLHEWWKYRGSFKTSGAIGIVGILNTLSFDYARHPMMGSITRVKENNDTYFLLTSRNQKSMSTLRDNLNAYVSLPFGLSLSAGATYSYTLSRGYDYTHKLGYWYFDASADWNHNNWNAGITWTSADKSLYGESVSGSGASNTVYVNYMLRNVRIGVTMLNALCKNGMVFRDNLRSAHLNKNETVLVPSMGNMVMLTLTWNFSKGKERRDPEIDLSNDDTDSGILKYK